jgi:hypothetical protein
MYQARDMREVAAMNETMRLADTRPGSTVRLRHSGQLVTVEECTPGRVRIRPVGRTAHAFVDAHGVARTIQARHPARDGAPSVPCEASETL